MMLDWKMVEGYEKPKEEVQQREEWRRQTFAFWFSAFLGREPEEDDKDYI